jgi:hypothetical protein
MYWYQVHIHLYPTGSMDCPICAGVQLYVQLYCTGVPGTTQGQYYYRTSNTGSDIVMYWSTRVLTEEYSDVVYAHKYYLVLVLTTNTTGSLEAQKLQYPKFSTGLRSDRSTVHNSINSLESVLYITGYSLLGLPGNASTSMLPG